MPWCFCPHVHRQSPRKDSFLDVRKDKHISFTRTKRGIFHTSTIFFSSRHPFPHSNWRLRLVLVRKWMSRTEKNRLVWKIPPFRPSDEIYISSLRSRKGRFLGVDNWLVGVVKNFSREVIRKEFFSCEVIRKKFWSPYMVCRRSPYVVSTPQRGDGKHPQKHGNPPRKSPSRR